MAIRLATEYVKACLHVTEVELSKLVSAFAEQGVKFHVHVLDNGNQEVGFEDGNGQEILLSFEKKAGVYECQGTPIIYDVRLANVMRKVICQFKGDAIVNRIYTGYTMVYHYERGSVVKIEEVKNGIHKLIYEHKDTLGQLEQLFNQQSIEEEITMIHSQINHLLEMRFDMKDPVIQHEIDGRLKRLTNRLFVLEA
ncbi:non-ribosomal peptide synthetase module [Paenibacillus sp. N1-5-1-14]|uniref:non-ribosomal peptide synthetase module n=1 Tax=Paenibacillus radicibacter TaxID=2972488 RepID=UPI002159272F|nr:non-ribosomal peptide synthetase module [Paenibacillus radicibacter]MCR8644183.1 non-ribosomal peptide synthetase module [Paenibacillus radicibacter]